ncbi:MAG TPA: TIGR03118 family protein [Steroidobacteraceae bacterium]|nr:TIGR03118 family protein [Steroidobacteraceae bacterium]
MHRVRALIPGAMVVALSCALSACGGGSAGSASSGGSSTGVAGATGALYAMTSLVSNSSAISALHTDANLVNAWGLAFNPQGFAWVSNQGSSTSTLYDGNGVLNPPYSGGPSSIGIAPGVSGVAQPTGIVFNPTTQFVISSGANSAPALFLYATIGGTIEGWAQAVNPNSAVIVHDNGASGSTYTGLTMAKDASGNYFLYAADFKNARVDVFNSSFIPTQVGGGFFDAAVPQGYAPYGIQNIPASDGSARIYVTFAQPVTTAQHVAMGTGLGYVSVFDAQGTLVTHLISQGALNAPWAVAMAPSNFGSLSGALLIGNFGDGTINAYNPSTGASMGPLMLTSTQQLVIPGLWALQFGNGINSQPANTLFFTAGPNSESAGEYGRIDVGGASSGTMSGTPGY